MKDALICEMHKRGINIRYLGLLALKLEKCFNKNEINFDHDCTGKD